MRLLILEDQKLKQTLQLGAGTHAIGSAPECGIHLANPKISGQQAQLTQDTNGDWWLEVLDAANPTCVNRAVQKGRSRLRHADEIELGPFSIRVFLESRQSPEEEKRQRLAALSRKHEANLPLDAIVHRFEHAVRTGKEHLLQHTLLALRLAQSESVPDLLVPLLKYIVRTFAAKRAWVGIRPPGKHEFEWSLGMNEQGLPTDRPVFSEGMMLRCMQHAQFVGCPSAPTAGVGSAMAVPLVGADGPIGMLYAENDAGDPAINEEGLDNFSALACCASGPVETVLRRSLAKRQSLVSTEQTLARAAQDALTPKAMPSWPDFLVAGFRQMGSARCCDFYDIVQLPDKSASVIVARLGADTRSVSRCMTEVRTAFRCSALHGDAPHLFARSLNWLAATGDSRQSLDMTTAWIAPATGDVNYCVAGDGVRVFHLTADGTCHSFSGTLADVIGKARPAALSSRTLNLKKGEALAFVSRGIEAARNAEGEPFGFDRVRELLEDGAVHSPGQTLSEFSSDLAEFLENGTCPEDVTAVLLRRG